MRTSLLTLAFAATVVTAAPASAAIFSFSYTGANTINGAFAVSGTLTTTNTTISVGGRQAYTITGITGTRNGAAISGLAAAGTDFGGVANDNYLFAAGPYFTDAGFGYAVTGTNLLFNPYSFGGGYEEYVSYGGGFGESVPIAFTLTPVAGGVPEPSTWAMMLAGFGLLGAALRRRSGTIAFT